MACDPYRSSVVLALHMDGTNGSTTFTDSSPSAKTVTANGNAQISTAQSKFGGASAYFDGTGDYLSVASSTDLEFGASDFTVEFLVRIDSSSGQSTILAHRASDITQGPLAIFRPSGTTNLRLYLSTGTSSWNILNGGVVANALGTGVWKHIAICRNGSTFTAFVDGVSSIIGSSSATIASSSADWSIGGDLNNNYFAGYIDDLRITKGVARYTANFTAPTAAYPDNQCVISGVVKDASGNLAERLVRAYLRSSGKLLGQTLSNPATGDYSIPVESDKECFVVCHDSSANPPSGGTENAVILDRVIPI